MIEKGAYQHYNMKEYRKESIRTAKELGYDNSVISKIKTAKTEREITDILAKARRGG